LFTDEANFSGFLPSFISTIIKKTMLEKKKKKYKTTRNTSKYIDDSSVGFSDAKFIKNEYFVLIVLLTDFKK